MGVKVVIELPQEEFNALTDISYPTREKLIESTFLQMEEEEIGGLLGGYCLGERETYNNDPVVMNVSFDDEISGTIDVSFTGSAYFGCTNMDRLDEHDVTVAFTIAPDVLAVQFETDPPERAERSTDEF
jgi:hypothetical protein